jgi:hexosaminidase
MFVNTMMPLPAEASVASGDLVLSPTTTFRISAPANEPLRDAAERMIMQLQSETYLRFTTALDAGDGRAAVMVKVADVSKTLPSLGDDESYHLDVENGAATLQAATLFGAYHTMETFLQLVQVKSGGYVIPALHIADSPRFQWGGLMLDTGRNFLSVAAVLRTLDGMAAVKLKVNSVIERRRQIVELGQLGLDIIAVHDQGRLLEPDLRTRGEQLLNRAAAPAMSWWISRSSHHYVRY